MTILSGEYQIDPSAVKAIEAGGFEDAGDEKTVITVFKSKTWICRIVHYGYKFIERDKFKSRQDALDAIPNLLQIITLL